MSERPWLTIVGLGEDGPAGLTSASRDAIDQAQVILGPARHLALLGPVDAETRPWPVPFAQGVDALLALRGQAVVALVSGDPFWFGAGTVLARHLAPGEWTALPGLSCFTLAAARLGWALDETPCLGLHAAPLGRLRPYLSPGTRVMATLRDGAAVADLGAYLSDTGFGASTLVVCEALGGPRECLTQIRAETVPDRAFAHPVLAALEVAGDGRSVSLASGREDDLFDHDGQITKRPVRALALSALAPRPKERLWDIGGGSGSIAIEWLWAHPSLQAISFEARPDRAARLTANALSLGCDRLHVVTGAAPESLAGQDLPDAVFIGGGLSETLIAALHQICPRGTRVVAHGVTLEAEALLAAWHGRQGGSLHRVELADAAPLGSKTAWKSAYPIVQWRGTL